MHNTAGSFVQGDVERMMHDAGYDTGYGNGDCGFRICFPVLLIFFRLCFRHARKEKGKWPLTIDSKRPAGEQANRHKQGQFWFIL